MRLRSALLYYLNRAGIAPRRRRLLFFDSDSTVPAHSSATSTIEVLDRDALAGLEFCGGWLSREEALRKIASPRCWMVGAHRGGSLVGYLWGELGTANVSFFDLEIPLPDTFVYLANVFVAPEARGERLYLAMYAQFAAEAHRRGITRVIVCFDPDNTPIIRLHRRLGFRHYLSASYLRLGPWRRYRVETPGGAPVLITGSPEAAASGLLS
jgi:ribosomal protein S18 acetylase RimI-like enzyme